MRHLFLFLLLLLAGCSSRQNYAAKLKLPPLELPTVMTPITAEGTKEFAPTISAIESAQTPSQADAVVSQIRMGTTLVAAFGNGFQSSDTPEMQQKKTARQAEANRLAAYIEQAAQIKRAQLEDGDAKDSTGEVAILLGYARQSDANLSFMNQSIPKIIIGGRSTVATPTLAPVPTPDPSPVSPSPVEPSAVEQEWFDHLGKTLDGVNKTNINTVDQSEMAVNRAELSRIVAQYKRLPVPPRFSTADSFFRKGFDEMEQVYSLTYDSISTQNPALLEQARAHSDASKSFLDKGFDNLGSFARSLRR